MVKQQSTSIITLKCFRSFVHHIAKICGSIVRGRNEAVRMTMHRYQIYNFRFQLLRQEIVPACNIATVFCNLHVQENLLSWKNFTSRQSKTISRFLEFRVPLQNFRVSFWHFEKGFPIHAAHVHCFACLQRQAAKLTWLFYCLTLLRNDNMATNLHVLTSNYGGRHFVACPVLPDVLFFCQIWQFFYLVGG